MDSSRVGGMFPSRHSPIQIAKLEEAFKENPHPNKSQRQNLGEELGLDQQQIKYWFQNRRIKAKALGERIDITNIQIENENLLAENMMMREELKNILCSACGGPPLEDQEEHQVWLQNLKLENAQLKQETERMSKLLSRYNGTDRISQPAAGVSQDDMLPPTTSTRSDMEKTIMVDTATTAMEELERLLRMNEPFWFRSSTDDEKFILQRQCYEHVFHRRNRFKGPHARFESSKDHSQIVSMGATQLVDMFLDADKWVDLFPTIVKKAQTIEILESGLSGRSGSLQLMYAEMHILSPLVPTRKFLFLRYCKQVEEGLWVIADVSFDSSIHNATLSQTWRLPSGCMIQEMTNESCMVTWVEHVEVDDNIQTHQLFRELICNNNAYGAQRWVLTLERMCQRFASASVENIPVFDAGGVINSVEGRRSVMQLAHRMTKMFCGKLDMSENLDLTHLIETDNSEIRVFVRNSTTMSGMPQGIIVSATTSFWLPLSPRTIIDFLKDYTRRPQWDVLCNEKPVYEMQRISNGTHPDNCTTIIQPFKHNEKNMMILQESCADPMGALIVYAPLDVPAINVAIRGEESSMLSILPSGFTISENCTSEIAVGQSSAEHDEKLGGSLVTLAIQILACSPSTIGKFNMETVVDVTEMVASTVEKIRIALDCPKLG